MTAYHVVCRDCTAESRVEGVGEETVRELAEGHEEMHGHRVAYAELDL